MTYRAQDDSVQAGQPYFLYQFDRNGTLTYLTSDASDLVRMSQTWAASPISHAEIEQSGNVERNTLELTFPLSDTFALEQLSPNSFITTVTVFRGHHTDATDEVMIYWKGRIANSKATKQNIILITENIFTSLRRPGCRARIQRTCRHDLYGLECGVDMNDWDVAVTITAISGLMLTVPAASGYTDSTFRAGMIKWNNIFGYVDYHSGTSVRLTSEIPGLEEAIGGGSQAAILYHGCDRSLVGTFGCQKFSNQLNYGGFRWIPKFNPFKGNSII
jgi:uncharacterized phage protein (TIGR02218 family)